MNNLDRIKAAWKMGWAAQLKLETGAKFTVVCWPLIENAFGLKDESTGMPLALMLDSEKIDGQYKYEITGYLYAGQLAGNEPIPKDQKFRIKRELDFNITQGEIFTFYDLDDQNLIHLKGIDGGISKEDLEPVFD